MTRSRLLGWDIKRRELQIARQREHGKYKEYLPQKMIKALAAAVFCSAFLLVALPSSMPTKDCSGRSGGRHGVPLGVVDAVAPGLTPLECPGVLAGRFWGSAEGCGRGKRSGALPACCLSS